MPSRLLAILASSCSILARATGASDGEKYCAPLPRQIHFLLPPGTAPGNFPVRVWEVAVSAWRRWFPSSWGFQHLFWTEGNVTECMREEFPELYGAFLALSGGIERADLGRLCILHRNGGIYSDLDYEPRVNFYDSFPCGLVSVVESPYSELGESVGSCLMASPKQHPLWQRALEKTLGSFQVLRFDDQKPGTGPLMLSMLLKEIGTSGVHVLPCRDYQPNIHVGYGPPQGLNDCGAISGTRTSKQRGIHWFTGSHTSFVGVAMRSSSFLDMHPKFADRRLFREPLVHDVAAHATPHVNTGNRYGSLFALKKCFSGAGVSTGARTCCPVIKSDDAARAAKLLRGALQIQPDDADVRFLLGGALHAQGKQTDALREFCIASILDPQLESMWHAVGRTREELSAFGNAIGLMLKSRLHGDLASTFACLNCSASGEVVEFRP